MEGLREARRQAGLSQAKAAKAVGVSPSLWAMWERGEAEPKDGVDPFEVLGDGVKARRTMTAKVGHCVARRRQGVGLSQGELAAILGRSQQWLSKIEQGEPWEADREMVHTIRQATAGGKGGADSPAALARRAEREVLPLAVRAAARVIWYQTARPDYMARMEGRPIPRMDGVAERRGTASEWDSRTIPMFWLADALPQDRVSGKGTDFEGRGMNNAVRAILRRCGFRDFLWVATAAGMDWPELIGFAARWYGEPGKFDATVAALYEQYPEAAVSQEDYMEGWADLSMRFDFRAWPDQKVWRESGNEAERPTRVSGARPAEPTQAVVSDKAVEDVLVDMDADVFDATSGRVIWERETPIHPAATTEGIQLAMELGGFAPDF